MISDTGINLIKSFEGKRLKSYADVGGLFSIGYGHLIKAGEKFPSHISEIEAIKLLRQDVGFAENCVNNIIDNDSLEITQNQFDALVSFTYNLGCPTLEKSSLLKLIQKHEYKKASGVFLRYVKAGGKTIKGLLRRRKAEKKLFESEN